MAEMKNNKANVVTTGKCRLSFVNIFEPRAAQEGGEPKYSVTLYIPKTDTPTVEKLKAAVGCAKNKGAESKWGGKIPGIMEDPKNPFAGTTVHDADTERGQDGDLLVSKHPAAKGCYILHVASKNKPGVVDQDLNAIIDPSKVYSGCYGRANISFYPYNSNGKKGISAGLNHIQFLEDGEPLGSTVRVEDAFAN